MLKLSNKKSAIHLNFRVKRAKHPWDIVAEQTKKKRNVTSKMAHRTAKSLSKLSLVVGAPLDLSLEQDLARDLRLTDNFASPGEGFFLCPFCTCWFTHKKELNSHVKKWCDRTRSNLIFSAQSK